MLLTPSSCNNPERSKVFRRAPSYLWSSGMSSVCGRGWYSTGHIPFPLQWERFSYKDRVGRTYEVTGKNPVLLSALSPGGIQYRPYPFPLLARLELRNKLRRKCIVFYWSWFFSSIIIWCAFVSSVRSSPRFVSSPGFLPGWSRYSIYASMSFVDPSFRKK